MRTPIHIAQREAPLGRIVSVSGSQAVVLLHSPDQNEQNLTPPAEMGTLIKIETPGSIVLGLVSALTVPVPSHDPADAEMKIIELEFVGELPRDEAGNPQTFRRGISSYPALGHQVFHASNEILALAYACDAATGVKIGTIVQEPSIPAMVKPDELLGKHLAILGATGTGKSCSVALLLRNILAKSPNAHLVLLDPHREYSPAFQGVAEVVNSDNLNLPFWLLTFEEIVEILIGNQPGRDTDIETLRELIPLAKARYGANQRRGELRSMLSKSENGALVPSVDTPVPYRISDLVALLDEYIGKLELRGELAPYKRLKSRVETVSRDPRYAFMFGSLTVQDTMAEVLSRMFRVPVNGKPITIFELAGLPSEIINVVVSVLSRMTFDFAVWSEGSLPITLVCEEAHRYVPVDDSLGFEPTKRSMSKIAKEGRKYGVSLCVVSQRPAELDPTILSQCATILCMRLANERDQDIVRARVSDGSASLLEVLPSLATGEAVAFGEGVALPTRMRIDRLPADAMPRGSTAKFSEDWQKEAGDLEFVRNVVDRWRAQSHRIVPHDVAAEAAAQAEQQEAEPQAQPAPAPAPQPVQVDRRQGGSFGQAAPKQPAQRRAAAQPQQAAPAAPQPQPTQPAAQQVRQQQPAPAATAQPRPAPAAAQAPAQAARPQPQQSQPLGFRPTV